MSERSVRSFSAACTPHIPQLLGHARFHTTGFDIQIAIACQAFRARDCRSTAAHHVGALDGFHWPAYCGFGIYICKCGSVYLVEECSILGGLST